VTSSKIDTTRRQLLLAGSALAATSGLPLSTALAQSDDRYGIRGRRAPELEIDYWINGSGEPTQFSIAEQKGKWVFLKCFQNWCPGCHSSGFPTLKAFADEFHDHPKVAIAGIQTVFEGFSSNTQDDVRKLQLRYELPNIMGHDAGDPKNGQSHHRPLTMINYRTGGTPWLILIDPEGNVAFNDFHVNRDKLIEFVKEQVA